MSLVTYRNSFTFIDNLSRLSFIHGEKAEYELLATLSKVISFQSPSYYKNTVHAVPSLQIMQSFYITEVTFMPACK